MLIAASWDTWQMLTSQLGSLIGQFESLLSTNQFLITTVMQSDRKFYAAVGSGKSLSFCALKSDALLKRMLCMLLLSQVYVQSFASAHTTNNSGEQYSLYSFTKYTNNS